MSNKSDKNALDRGIKLESYEEFCDRVQRTVYYTIPRTELIFKFIESMNGRISEISNTHILSTW